MKFYSRVYQAVMRVASCFLPWRQPKLIKGENALTRLPKIIKEMGINHILVVTDSGLMKLHFLDAMLNQCEIDNLEYSLYDKTVPNPTISNIEEALTMYHSNNCQAIVAFGGGSSMDCAKGVAARVARPNRTISQMKGILKVGKKTPLLFAIPTTAGTGSETTLAAVITDDKTHYKYPINDPALFPSYAVLDPNVTIKLPPHITSTTGLDALCHAVESYIGKSNTKNTIKCAKEAVTLIFDNLYNAYVDGNNIEARENMQQAAYLAGVAFTRAYVGYVHAVAHSLGGQYNIPHGLANAVILPIVLRYYGKSVYKPLSQLAELIHVADESKTQEQNAIAFIEAIEQLNQKMNIPTHLPQIVESDIPLLVEHAYKEGNPLYPVPKEFDKADFTKIYYLVKG